MGTFNLSEVQDAKLLWGFLQALAGRDLPIASQTVYTTIGAVLKVYPNLEYTNIENILTLLVVHTYPNSTSPKTISNIVKSIVFEPAEDTIDESVVETIISFSYGEQEILDAVALNSAVEIVRDSKVQASLLVHSDEFPEELIFKFVRAKVLYSSKYGNNIDEFKPLFELIAKYEPFIAWYAGVVQPYLYYWNNFGKSSPDSIKFEQFEKFDSQQEVFMELIKPMNSYVHKERLGLKSWMSNVIIPHIKFYQKDFAPLLHWLFVPFEVQKHTSKYEIWNITIGTIIQSGVFDFEDYSSIIKHFIAGVYFYSISESEILTSIETIKVYDLILSTLNFIKTKKEPIELKNGFDQLPTYDTLNEFVEDKSNPLAPLFEPTGHSISALRNIVETCQKLFPINKLTISKYLQLRYSTTESNDNRREIIKITSNLNSSNSGPLLTSVQNFKNAFVPASELPDINTLVIERFLSAGLFNSIMDLNQDFEIPDNDLAIIILDKFWECFDLATNFDDRSGKLYECSQCIGLLDQLGSKQLLPETRKKIVAIKHLLKAISNMKNFKIHLGYNNPLTPHKLITKFRPEEDNSSLSLITLILELNPKSYLAFEKLYKILNDLNLFFVEDSQDSPESETDQSSRSAFNKLKAACIESALIDNNFPFAYKNSKQLFEHQENLNELWLTFYQVGKYISPDDPETIDILLKQREILSLTLEVLSFSSNTKAILRQWQVVNEKIEAHYTDSIVEDVTKFNDITISSEFKENIGAIANDIINEATASTNHASEKLSKMFVSGLGWAIGANTH
ncbi:uncharacterized protein CANTADRAFT_25913 [Suhomyces tanzawaensis NRRL Y-17324]|uniref:Sec39 domain-containing protein n=1 Tax=Suhomyces tanzawaensis NRRL Y-17324 TaxID=984487 RepID=A0A1E4SLI6_9ASCO|nr:uncharacterized protein CANTADRAFT_25913 [Suhomyces tanzawaensis NRRL Y-17324]ODV80252.1 hypothetical protein CANTADRAFT_25913 [Suhomyces tanzawaensis NRRL Y-17324]